MTILKLLRNRVFEAFYRLILVVFLKNFEVIICLGISVILTIFIGRLIKLYICWLLLGMLFFSYQIIAFRALKHFFDQETVICL